MTQIPNCDGDVRHNTEEIAHTKINLEWLKDHRACEDGIEWFDKTFPNGCTYLELRAKLAEDKKIRWENWIIDVVGGDIAKTETGTAGAGYRGTAVAGADGTAKAGDYGTAIAGDDGTATAGACGTAKAGYGGTAKAGDDGTATAGACGTAKAGYGGTAKVGNGGQVHITYYDGDRFRTAVGYVGESGIKPNVFYCVKDGKLVESHS